MPAAKLEARRRIETEKSAVPKTEAVVPVAPLLFTPFKHKQFTPLFPLLSDQSLIPSPLAGMAPALLRIELTSEAS
jgi:hypothetical protein